MYPKVSCSPGCPKSSGCMNLPGKYFLIGNYNLGGSSSIPCKTYIIYLLTFFYARLFNVFIISGNNITVYNKKKLGGLNCNDFNHFVLAYFLRNCISKIWNNPISVSISTDQVSGIFASQGFNRFSEKKTKMPCGFGLET